MRRQRNGAKFKISLFCYHNRFIFPRDRSFCCFDQRDDEKNRWFDHWQPNVIYALSQYDIGKIFTTVFSMVSMQFRFVSFCCCAVCWLFSCFHSKNSLFFISSVDTFTMKWNSSPNQMSHNLISSQKPHHAHTLHFIIQIWNRVWKRLKK